MAEDSKNVTSVPTAPYNFVSFTDAVLVSPLNEYVNGITEVNKVHEKFRSYLGAEQTFSGHFDIEIENLTPLYIGDKDGFLSVGKNLCVPGSSMRGCIKNIFKIITASAFRSNDNFPDGDVNDGHLYFRSFASAHNAFKDVYEKKMTSIDEKGKSRAVASAGFLVKMDKKYYICPAKYTREKVKDTRLANPDKDVSYQWENDCVAVYTGQMGTKKRSYYIFKSPDWNIRLEVPTEVILGYEADTTRKGINLLDENMDKKRKSSEGLELLQGIDEFDSVIPCFYVAGENGVTSFGSGPYYRVPYDKSIGSHIPEAVRTLDVDFTDAVFGNNKFWGSRVFFDDLYLKKEEAGKKVVETKLPLMSPNPTSFQNYLCASDKDSNHWDTDANLRGYKMYWHRNPELKVATNGNDNIISVIKALDKGNKFVGRIRFDNLRAEELGALVTVLELCKDDSKCFKLGKGKPYGLGCIRLRVEKLCIKDRNYYKTLFDDSGFNEPKAVDTNEYANAFSSFIRNYFDETQFESYEHSVEELKCIMDHTHMEYHGWNECTKYLNPTNKEGSSQKLINERIPLPTIEQVVKFKK